MQESQRNHFKEFVTPIYDNFKELHKNYTDAFKQYLEIIKDSPEPLTSSHPIRRKVEQDRSDTRPLRDSIVEFTELLEEPIFNDFYKGIHFYLQSTYFAIDDELKFDNAPRGSLISFLDRIEEINEENLSEYTEQIKNGYIKLPGCVSIRIDNNNLFKQQALEENDQKKKVDCIRKATIYSFAEHVIDELNNRNQEVTRQYAKLSKIFSK